MAFQNVDNGAIREIAVAERLSDLSLSGVTIEFSDADSAASIRLNDEGEALKVSFCGWRDETWGMLSAQRGRFDRISFWACHCLLSDHCEDSQVANLIIA
ncbi:MAG: hypothetical protein BGP04_12865 [Rhizobiales bacterium 62-17]|nr:MAG: hypothetical protein BGP04_12865 [Rhizobiales bacterium 62-17]